ncbi:hypothetical protein HID58_048391, partial [Brassica napus]
LGRSLNWTDPSRRTAELDPVVDQSRPFAELYWSSSANGRAESRGRSSSSVRRTGLCPTLSIRFPRAFSPSENYFADVHAFGRTSPRSGSVALLRSTIPGFSRTCRSKKDMATEEEADEYNISEVDWGEEPGYSWEGQNYGDGSEEDDQCRESRAEDGYEEEPCRGELDSKPQDHYKNHTINKSYSKPWIKFTDKFYDYSPTVFTKTLVSFSGKENYSRWEEDMENYFWEYKVPEHKKLSIALDTLVGEAYQWWLQEEECRIYFKEPTPHWAYVKELMYEHFEMRRLPPRTCPKRFVKLKPRQLHEREEKVKTLENIFSGKRTWKGTSSETPFQKENTCPMDYLDSQAGGSSSEQFNIEGLLEFDFPPTEGGSSEVPEITKAARMVNGGLLMINRALDTSKQEAHMARFKAEVAYKEIACLKDELESSRHRERELFEKEVNHAYRRGKREVVEVMKKRRDKFSQEFGELKGRYKALTDYRKCRGTVGGLYLTQLPDYLFTGEYAKQTGTRRTADLNSVVDPARSFAELDWSSSANGRAESRGRSSSDVRQTGLLGRSPNWTGPARRMSELNPAVDPAQSFAKLDWSSLANGRAESRARSSSAIHRTGLWSIQLGRSPNWTGPARRMSELNPADDPARLFR